MLRRHRSTGSSGHLLLHVTLVYTYGLAAVAAAMLLLPALYLVTIGLFAYALLWYARFRTTEFIELRDGCAYASPSLLA
jgi:hypothetical protein